jgi:hypothetical protein
VRFCVVYDLADVNIVRARVYLEIRLMLGQLGTLTESAAAAR